MDLIAINYPIIITIIITILGVLALQSVVVGIGIILYWLYMKYCKENTISQVLIKMRDIIDMREYKYEIVKKPDKLEDNSYIFGCHPHGAFNMSIVFGLFGDFANFSENYPNLTLHLLALPIFFNIPIIREILSMFGIGMASESFYKELIKTGKSPVVLAGGVHEILYSGTRSIPVNITKREGMFRIGIETGTKIVPVLTENENDNYYYLHNPINRWLIEKLGILIPVAWGRKLFLPRNTEYKIYIGNPIETEGRNVEEVKSEYIEEIKRLGEENSLKIELI